MSARFVLACLVLTLGLTGGYADERASAMNVEISLVELAEQTGTFEVVAIVRADDDGRLRPDEFFERGVPHTEMIDTFYIKPWLHTKFPDVFDDNYVALAEEEMRNYAWAFDDPYFIGFFVLLSNSTL